jgi:hypothetical protein
MLGDLYASLKTKGNLQAMKWVIYFLAVKPPILG